MFADSSSHAEEFCRCGCSNCYYEII